MQNKSVIGPEKKQSIEISVMLTAHLIGDYQKAIEYLKKRLKIATQSGDQA